MKEAIGGVSLFQIVVVFVLIFTAVMCLTINHSKAFGVKDEIITIIESGVLESNSASSYAISEDTAQEISEKLVELGYRITGDCSTGFTGYNRDGSVNSSGKNSAFCIKATDVSKSYYEDAKNKCKNNKCETISGDFPPMVYYEVVLFYRLDIPIVDDIGRFELKSSTKVIYG